ncbi:MAG: hypothetical protein JNK82_08110, partial [Myxococcaceae bacterium]|nr:hypothetical protein [Myxococcaceae bacterium]
MQLLVGTDRIALLGLEGRVTTHAHATAAVIVAVDRPLRLHAGGRSRDLRAALLAPGFQHALDLRGGRLGVFLLPPSYVERPLTELDGGPWLELVTRFAGFDAVDDELGATARPLDDRLRRALELMTVRLDENLPLEELASAVRLSPVRLMTLAREQLGTSLRSYR